MSLNLTGVHRGEFSSTPRPSRLVLEGEGGGLGLVKKKPTWCALNAGIETRVGGMQSNANISMKYKKRILFVKASLYVNIIFIYIHNIIYNYIVI